MKKIVCLLLILILIALAAGCISKSETDIKGANETPLGTAAPGTSNEPNVWAVTKDAPVIDAATGKEAGTAFPGFMVGAANVTGNKASFAMTSLDEKGENVKEIKTYTIDTSYMEKKYVEPQAVIMIISVDMIELKPNAVLCNGNGEKVLSFKDAVGPFRFIQKSDKGYMFTIDFNVVFAKEADVNVIKLGA